MKIVQIKPEKAKDLIEVFERYQSSLYPSESRHMDRLGALSNKNVIFYGAMQDENIIAIGAVEIFKNYGEIKHVFVMDDHRGKGLGKMIMAALENYLIAQSIRSAKLKIGILQYEALGLYRNLDYKECHAFGTYRPDPLTVYMTKSFK